MRRRLWLGIRRKMVQMTKTRPADDRSLYENGFAIEKSEEKTGWIDVKYSKNLGCGNSLVIHDDD